MLEVASVLEAPQSVTLAYVWREGASGEVMSGVGGGGVEGGGWGGFRV